jgi:hypothetical protein
MKQSSQTSVDEAEFSKIIDLAASHSLKMKK